ncbi:MAG: amino acid racemase [Woeseiaceae bacterium]|nr:amino acid racemase [Woeseiaceae bacterium]
MNAIKTVGVLGGMGPDATVDFMAKVIAATPAERDQDHIPMLIDHDPRVPSRQDTTPAEDVTIREMLAAMAVRLEAAGADFLVMVCNTAHGWLDLALERTTVPFVDIVEVTADALTARHPAVRTVGIMATPACLEAGLYQRVLESRGLASLPAEGRARRDLMRLIDRVKAGDQGEDVAAGMAVIAQGLVAQGADAVIAGCTEIPLVLAAEQLPVPLISSTDELARRTVALALGEATLQSRRHLAER